jgi:hypothetical protein
LTVFFLAIFCINLTSNCNVSNKFIVHINHSYIPACAFNITIILAQLAIILNSRTINIKTWPNFSARTIHWLNNWRSIILSVLIRIWWWGAVIVRSLRSVWIAISIFVIRSGIIRIIRNLAIYIFVITSIGLYISLRGTIGGRALGGWFALEQ